MTPQQRAEALDWLAWTDPDDGRGLSQAKIGTVGGRNRPGRCEPPGTTP